MLDAVTAFVLTRDEGPNIGRVLEKLRWAPRVIVCDSGSSDDTRKIACDFPNTHLIERPFESFAAQRNHVLQHGGIDTEWVMALDADYVLSDTVINEIERLNPAAETAGYRIGFRYCIEGQPLRASLYPPRVVLFRRASARYVADGHQERLHVDGRIEQLSGTIDHDDRKPLDRWLASQCRYMNLEADKLVERGFTALDWADRLRKLRIVFPFLVIPYTLLLRATILDGRRGVYYAFQRGVAELLLSLLLLERDLRRLSGRRQS